MKSNQKSFISINVQLKHRGGNTEARILIDSGIEGLLIDKQFCQEKEIKLKKIAMPIPIFNVDRSANKGGVITDKACLLMRMTNLEGDYHNEQCELLVTNLGGENVILGIDWLHKHNPQINWVKNCLIFTSCSTLCIISRPKVVILAEKLAQPGHGKTINYTKIENKLEDLPEEEEKDLEGINKFLTELYKNQHNDSPFELDPSEAVCLQSTHSKSQELAEEANKKLHNDCWNITRETIALK